MSQNLIDIALCTLPQPPILTPRRRTSIAPIIIDRITREPPILPLTIQPIIEITPATPRPRLRRSTVSPHIRGVETLCVAGHVDVPAFGFGGAGGRTDVAYVREAREIGGGFARVGCAFCIGVEVNLGGFVGCPVGKGERAKACEDSEKCRGVHVDGW